MLVERWITDKGGSPVSGEERRERCKGGGCKKEEGESDLDGDSVIEKKERRRKEERRKEREGRKRKRKEVCGWDRPLGGRPKTGSSPHITHSMQSAFFHCSFASMLTTAEYTNYYRVQSILPSGVLCTNWALLVSSIASSAADPPGSA